MAEAASADHDAASEFPVKFLTIIEEKGYKSQQVFSEDETGFLWRKMSFRTYLVKEDITASGFKAAKDCLTFILRGSASGDFKCKAILV